MFLNISNKEIILKFEARGRKSEAFFASGFLTR